MQHDKSKQWAEHHNIKCDHIWLSWSVRQRNLNKRRRTKMFKNWNYGEDLKDHLSWWLRNVLFKHVAWSSSARRKRNYEMLIEIICLEGLKTIFKYETIRSVTDKKFFFGFHVSWLKSLLHKFLKSGNVAREGKKFIFKRFSFASQHIFSVFLSSTHLHTCFVKKNFVCAWWCFALNTIQKFLHIHNFLMLSEKKNGSWPKRNS